MLPLTSLIWTLPSHRISVLSRQPSVIIRLHGVPGKSCFISPEFPFSPSWVRLNSAYADAGSHITSSRKTSLTAQSKPVSFILFYREACPFPSRPLTSLLSACVLQWLLSIICNSPGNKDYAHFVHVCILSAWHIISSKCLLIS